MNKLKENRGFYISISVIFIVSIFYLGMLSFAIRSDKANATNETETIVLTTDSKDIVEHVELTEVRVTKPQVTYLAAKKTTKKTEKKKQTTKYYNVPLSKKLQDHIFKTCKGTKVKPSLVIAIIEHESNYKIKAVGDKGNSLGLMQIQPRWNKERMKRLRCNDLLDPYQNITVGIDVLNEYFKTGRSTEWVLMAYNSGPSYANRKAKNGEVSNYARTVLRIRDRLSG